MIFNWKYACTLFNHKLQFWGEKKKNKEVYIKKKWLYQEITIINAVRESKNMNESPVLKS